MLIYVGFFLSVFIRGESFVYIDIYFICFVVFRMSCVNYDIFRVNLIKYMYKNNYLGNNNERKIFNLKYLK